MTSVPDPDDDEYDSAADSDFNASLSASSGEESEDEGATDGKKRKQAADGDLEMGSGDEGIVAQGRKKRRKKSVKGKSGSKDAGDEMELDEGEDDEAGAGIRVRLRSGRGGESAQKAAIPKASAATANIDEIWASMNDPAFQAAPPPEAREDIDSTKQATRDKTSTTTKAPAEVQGTSLHEPEPTISIPHTYTFAGHTTTSTKTVPLSSPAAQTYLASLKKTLKASPQPQSQEAEDATGKSAQGPPLRRPLARKSLFEPNPTCFLAVRGHILPPRADLPRSIGGGNLLKEGIVQELAAAKENLSTVISKVGAKAGKKDKGEKLNTVEKSKLDWEAEVDRLGLREELEKAEKDRGSYLNRRDFLDRVEMAGEERARQARLAETG